MPRILAQRLLWVIVALTVRALPSQAAEPLNTLLAQEQQLMAAAAKQPDDVPLRRRVAAVRTRIAGEKFNAGKIDEAVAYLENAVALDPDDPARWSMLGDYYQFLGVAPARFLAQDAYERALALEPGRRPTRIKLAAAYLAATRFQKAIEAFEAVIPGDKSQAPDGEYIVPLAVAYTLTDQAARGIAFCERMRKAGGDGRFTVALAALKHHKGDRRAAIKLLQEAEGAHPRTTLARYALRLRHQYENEDAPQ